MSFKNNLVKLASALHSVKIILKRFPLQNQSLKKNNRGFSLVELMIVVGLLAGVSLVVMNLTKQTNKSSSKYQFDSEIMLITNEINGILSDPNKCLTTFTNATQAASPATPVLNATPANVTNPTGIAEIPSTARKYTLAGGPYGNGGVMIASYSLDLAATPDPLLTINFSKKAILGTGTTPKTIKLYVEKTGPGVITLCRSISTASTDIWSRGTGTDIFYAGGVRVGDETQATICDASSEGTQRYNKSIHAMEYCGASGSPLIYAWTPMGGGGIKAWVRFNGDGTSACAGNVNCPISGSSNISHVYHYLPSRGVYQIFFATPQPNVNYVVTGTTSYTAAGNCGAHIVVDSDAIGTSYTRTTSYFFVSGVNDQSGACWARNIELQVVGN